MFEQTYFIQTNIDCIRSFMLNLKRKLAVVFCLMFMVSALITTYAGAASGGGGGGVSRSSASGGGGGGVSRSSASGGGGGMTVSAAGGGGTGTDEEDDSFDDYSDDDFGPEYENSSSNNSGSSGSRNGNSVKSASGGGSGKDNVLSLEGYVPVAIANINSGASNMSGVMLTNGVDNKFVVIYKDGKQTSEYLKDWAVLTTQSGSQGWYHFDNDGNMSTGFINDSKGNTYYMMESGENEGMMAVGTININGSYYSFSDGSDGREYGALVK